MQLITYADRLAKNLSGLNRLLRGSFAGLFDAVHILPFFDAVDGADAGFDPVDHSRVDQRLGDWEDVSRISQTCTVMADLIVNHISSESPMFLDVLARGRQSEYWDLFLKKPDVFAGDDPEIQKIYRPRPGSPFTPYQLASGEVVDFWTTFSPRQIDINLETPQGKRYLSSLLSLLAGAGVREVRLDAAGYAIKRRGTSCFMLPETYDFIEDLTLQAQALGIETLVEIHNHHLTQIQVAGRVGRVYDFALPALVLYALYEGDAQPLAKWLTQAPRNCVTVLDTHDGIGIVDVAPAGDNPGLLTAQQVDSLVEKIHEKSDGESARASGNAASNLDVYQINTTYFSALGHDPVAYLIARAVQFFSPGTPQVYYVGLMAGRNDMDLFERTGVGRDINRHYYEPTEVSAALEQPVVQRLVELIRLRGTHPAFDGEFRLSAADSRLEISWETGDSARLTVDFRSLSAEIETTIGSQRERYLISRDRLGYVEHVQEPAGP